MGALTHATRAPEGGGAPAAARRGTDQPRGLLALQQHAGNAAVTAMVQRLVDDSLGFEDAGFGAPAPDATAPTAGRPDLRRGDLNVDVGVAQQKLNIAGADPRLEVDAEFGSRTERAVKAFQGRNGLPATGVIDASTWAALDTAVPGGEVAPDGTAGPVSTGKPADPTQTIETPIHPTLRKGASGAAVNELHEKLNRALGTSLVIALSMEDADGIEFTDETETAVATFQRRNGLGLDGVAGPKTWEALDTQVPGAMIGRREMTVSEQVRGERGFRGNEVNYNFEIEGSVQAPTRLVIKVGYDFTIFDGRDDGPGLIFAGIKRVWNRFEAIEFTGAPGQQPRGPVMIDFEPVEGSDQAVNIHGTNGASNSANYFLGAGIDIDLLAGHEFGHHIGLADEYQQTAADHERHTGEAVPIGQITGDAPPEQIAQEIRAAIFSAPEQDRGQKTLDVIQGHSLEQGAFAQQVARRYVNMFGRPVTDDINDHIPQDGSKEGSLTKRRLCTQPFMYNQDGLMAGAEATHAHQHDVQPRHVRHLVKLLSDAVGGTWEPADR